MTKKGGKKKSTGARGKSGAKRSGTSAAGAPARKAGAGAKDPYGIGDLAHQVLRGGDDLLALDDPLDAEDWASQMLGMFYKPHVPFDVLQALERSLGPSIVQGAERLRNAKGMAILCALAAVLGDQFGVREAAARMAAHGVPRPRWADQAGQPEFLGGWTMADPFGDQIGYYLTFRYPGRPPHLLMALYDENLGGIIKDAFFGQMQDGTDPRSVLGRDPDVTVRDVDPAEARARIEAAVATGDLFLDNDWTEEFKQTRALLLARLRRLPSGPVAEAPPAADLKEQEVLTQEFLRSPLAPDREETLAIVDHCMIARCEYGDGDPLRWSPVVVELFMLDFLPRKVTLSFAEVQALPEVLKAWVRFALTKRGLEERFIVETQQAVDDFTPEFRQAVTDPESFGPAKAISNAMKADGVDLLDQAAVNAWLADFNSLPDEARRSFFGRHIQD